MAFWPGFHLASLVVGAWLVAVLIPQMNLDSCEVFFVALERAFNGGSYPLLQSDAAVDMVIAVDLDLHSSSLLRLARMRSDGIARGRSTIVPQLQCLGRWRLISSALCEKCERNIKNYIFLSTKA